jgi:hypothetical protein
LKIKPFWYWLFILPLFNTCSLERRIEVKLPPYKRELVAECYLDRQDGLKVILTESDSYFDTLRFPAVNYAKLNLSVNGVPYPVPFNPFLDLENRKFYNYQLPAGDWLDTTARFELEISDSTGRKLSGTTAFLPAPDLDSLEVRYTVNEDTSIAFVVWINDFAGQSNFYRIIMNEDSLNGPPVLEFSFTDNGLDGQRFPVGTTSRFRPGKRMFIRLFHIEQQYYLYLRAMEAASRANGNPFAQPATLTSPMKGGFGLFSTLNYIQLVRDL